MTSRIRSNRPDTSGKPGLFFFSGERPVGTDANNDALIFLDRTLAGMGYEVVRLPFDCFSWRGGTSYIEIPGSRIEIFPGPFSKPFSGVIPWTSASTWEELSAADACGRLLVLSGSLAAEPLMPIDFPFYYPDRHRDLIGLLQKKNPAALLAVTGKHPMCGLEPFPLFEDGNFTIPACYSGMGLLENFRPDTGRIGVFIDSSVSPCLSSQLVASRKGRIPGNGRIVVCAHMDTKYGTPGALDNGCGVDVMLAMARSLRGCDLPFDLEFVPFNGEEYYGVSGQLEYLKAPGYDPDSIRLVVNIDSPCRKGAKPALSFYNAAGKLHAAVKALMKKNPVATEGDQWYAGDHTMFASRGIPCIAVTSADFSGVADIAHTGRDTPDGIDIGMIYETAGFLSSLILDVSRGEETAGFRSEVSGGCTG